MLRFFPNGVVNADGLHNRGLKWWIKKVYPKLNSKYQVIVSIFPTSPEECKQMIQMLNWCKNIAGIEINLSCPNTEHETGSISYNHRRICIMARKISLHPLILKVGYTHDNQDTKEACKGFEALDLMNTIPWSILFPDKESPLRRYGGGVSGKIIYPLLRKKLDELRGSISIPIIVGGGISVGSQVLEICPNIMVLVESGVGAVSFGTLFLQKPWQPNQIVQAIESSNGR